MHHEIEVDNLDFSYRGASGATSVLSGISFGINKGEFVAIQGPSGSGKSTLLYLIGGLLNEFRGRISVAGHDLKKMNDFDRALMRNQTIGFVFQQFYLLLKATVAENIELPSLYPSEVSLLRSRDRIRQVAELVGLGDKLGSYPNQLSGGQQQRVAIARAILNEPDIILADEPTGSLDSKTSQSIFDLLKQINRAGRTVIIITHDPEIAKQCDRIIHIRDGRVEIDTRPTALAAGSDRTQRKVQRKSRIEQMVQLVKLALLNLRQNRVRAALNMLGIVIGVAAVLAMMTIGTFTKDKILDSYADLGVNTIMFYGDPNWNMSAKDQVGVVFNGFDWEKDLIPLRTVFPDVLAMSPMMMNWGQNKAGFAGKTIDEGVRMVGVSADGLAIACREVMLGTYINTFHVQNRSPVCVIGYEIFERLFRNVAPIGQIIFLQEERQTFGCRVIGVLKSMTSNKEWNKPNLQIYFPYTYFRTIISDHWSTKMFNVQLRLKMGADVEKTGQGIRTFFERRYGKSAVFRVGSDSKLVAQMSKFLSLFTLMLTSIAIVSLVVGGIGITNMMMVSVSERLREIGIRKAFGATNASIRQQYLAEAIVICTLAGIFGIAVGFFVYETSIWAAAQVISKVQFEWVLNWPALLISLISIAVVGILSGLVPAVRAEKLAVIEALRNE